jgi:hypothetical protein
MTDQGAGDTENAAPGWYPDSNSGQRYWDGVAWTEHRADVTPTESGSRRNPWMIPLIVVGAIVVLCGGLGLLGALVGSSDDKTNVVANKSSTTTRTPPTTMAETSTSTVAATTSPASSPPVTTPPTTPPPTAAPTVATTVVKTTTTKAASPGMADVSITSCKAADNEYIAFEAGVRVTNNSSKESNYMISIVFQSPDGKTQYDTGQVAVNNLAPGQTANETTYSLKSENRGKPVTCKVADVVRYAS